ncbi:metal-dependent hydrolase family protein [Brevundimonas lenta]|uniref:Imidazolonepropionase-like amidohydrolase n=1 Tax=Brevundimonas lenta TaxID=424796 RepID=A0A7W6JDK4_9CAUL|nr:amidohydrolase family protein [Brevundimonas lenta]MBB4083136.1 imidazolonepropionase-like amidohydrolase [Brevundimonas lenta]
MLNRLAVAAAALAAVLSLSAPANAETLVVTAARMVDVERGRYIDNPVVVVTDGRIVSVGTTLPANLPADAERLDLGGLTLLPGLIDMHVHLANTPYVSGFNILSYADDFETVLQVPNARANLDAGFTTVRNLGGPDFADVALMQAIDAGFVVGPRVVPAGVSFGATGGHCDYTGMPRSLAQANDYNADSVDEARHSVREVRKYGARVIKICATGGVFSRNTEPGQQQMTLAEMTAVADEAHMWGLKVAAHAHGASGIRDAILAGIDTIEHASLIDAEGIRLAVQHGTWLSMDIYNTDFTQATGTEFGVTEDNLRKDREIGQLQRDNFRAAHDAGARMVFGTDAAIYPHGQNAKQFAVMVEYGMTPAEAIRAATWNAGQALGQENNVGAIAVGRYGDLIAVAGDPLADVRALETVAVVVKGGEVVKDAR